MIQIIRVLLSKKKKDRQKKSLKNLKMSIYRNGYGQLGRQYMVDDDNT